MICIIQILGQDTEPEDLSIRANVVEKLNETTEFFGLGDESDTSQPIPECKKITKKISNNHLKI